MMKPERYEGEHDDLRFEYARDQAYEEHERLRQEADCTDECDDNCTCVQDTLDDQQAQKDLENDFWNSRGV